ncbi:MAG: integrase, partial [Sulfolobales archaeon]
LKSLSVDELLMRTANLYLYVKNVKVSGRRYRYLIVEEYLGQGRRKVLLRLPVDEVIRRLLWCGGWDSNPRRPTPSGPQPDPAVSDEGGGDGVLKQYVLTHLNGYYSFCVKTASEETCEQYVRYIQRGLDESNKWSVLAWKKFLKYLCDEVGNNNACVLHEKLKCRKSGVDKYVPSDQEVIETLTKSEEPFKNVYWVLVQSGLRLNEAVFLISNIDKLRKTKVGDFWRVELDLERGSKRSFYAYLVELPQKAFLTPDAVSKYSSRRGLLQPKYIRKWVATKMLSLGIPSEVVDFMQGRTPNTILTRHYLNLLTLADQNYPKYSLYIMNSIREYALHKIPDTTTTGEDKG